MNSHTKVKNTTEKRMVATTLTSNKIDETNEFVKRSVPINRL